MSASDDTALSGAQCRAARALTDVSRAVLSDMSGVDEAVIGDFERKIAAPSEDVRARLRLALEAHGAIFLADDGQGGQGVRLKFTAAETARIDRLENEGGPTGEDDIAD